MPDSDDQIATLEGQIGKLRARLSALQLPTKPISEEVIFSVELHFINYCDRVRAAYNALSDAIQDKPRLSQVARELGLPADGDLRTWLSAVPTPLRSILEQITISMGGVALDPVADDLMEIGNLVHKLTQLLTNLHDTTEVEKWGIVNEEIWSPGIALIEDEDEEDEDGDETDDESDDGDSDEENDE